MSHIALLLGSNVGNRSQYLSEARQQIQDQLGSIIKVSTIVETEPWGNTNQGKFINQAVLVETESDPESVLDTILKIEKNIGRIRNEKWGPRIIDIDILYYDALVIEKENLKVPHPYMQDRRFSLVPLQEISPEWVHPVFWKTVKELLEDCTDNGIITEYIE